MDTVGLNHHENREVIGALQRAEREDRAEAPRPSDLVKLAAIACIGAGVALDGVAVLVSFTVLGAAALWLSLRHDDSVVSRGVERHFDRATGLPLAQSLETVLRDELVGSSLSGRFAVVAVEVPEISAREVADDPGAADALMAAITHRLQTQGWIDSASGPFGPLIFLRRPGVFFVVLRDVLDDRTTRWLAGRMVEVLNRPVRWNGEELDARAVIGVAVGNSANRLDLVRQANDARQRARRQGAGTVVSSVAYGTAATPRQPGSLVSLADRSTVARLIDSPPVCGEMFADTSTVLRAIDEAIQIAMSSGDRCFVRVPGSALYHWRLPAEIAARINAAGAHGRLGLVVPSDLADRSVRIAWRNLEQLRLIGVDVFLDRSAADGRRPFDGGHAFDGVVAPSGSAADVLRARDDARSALRSPDAPVVTIPDDASALDSAVIANGTDRTVEGGRTAQLTQGSVTSAR